MRKKGRAGRIEAAWGLAFIVPSMIQVLFFFLIPAAFCIYAGFTNWNVLQRSQSFVGMANFAELFGDPKFWKAAGNTIYMLIPIPIYLFLALLFAIACNRGTPGNRVFRVLYYLPYISSIVALVVMWKYLFNYQYGLINSVLSLFDIQGPNWLTDPDWVKRTIVIMIAWKLIGITSIYYLAALKNIPGTLYEAAKIDGASPLQLFVRITLPLTTPITFFLLTVGAVGSLQTFVEVQLFTTDGGRNYSAATLVYYIWQKAFGVSGEMGLASAAAAIFGLFIMIVTVLQFKFSKKWVYEGG